MLLHAITQRTLFPGDEKRRQEELIKLTRSLAQGGVAYIQIREKDLHPVMMKALAVAMVETAQAESTRIKILLNGPPAIALEAGCHGIHLAGGLPPDEALTARRLYAMHGRECMISAACHSIQEIRERSAYADMLLFSPVFEKKTPGKTLPGTGLQALSQAVQEAKGCPVLALGGVNTQNAMECTAAGAKGVAAIRLFMDQQWKQLTDA